MSGGGRLYEESSQPAPAVIKWVANLTRLGGLGWGLYYFWKALIAFYTIAENGDLLVSFGDVIGFIICAIASLFFSFFAANRLLKRSWIGVWLTLVLWSVALGSLFTLLPAVINWEYIFSLWSRDQAGITFASVLRDIISVFELNTYQPVVYVFSILIFIWLAFQLLFNEKNNLWLNYYITRMS